MITGAKLTLFQAVALGPVALVKAIGSTQVFWGIVFGWLLSSALPAWFHENTSGSVLVRKTAFAWVMFAGVMMVG